MIPALPLEIIQTIIHFSLPETEPYSTFPLRSSLLLSFSLVNRQWHSLSHHLLFSSIHLPTPEVAHEYLLSTEGTGLRGKCERMRMGGGASGEQVKGRERVDSMMSVLRGMEGLKEVWMLDMSPVSFSYFSSCTQLHSLSCSGLKFLEPFPRPPSQPFIIPALRSLTIVQSWLAIIVSSVQPDLHPVDPGEFWISAFPPLKRVAICETVMLDSELRERPLDLYGKGRVVTQIETSGDVGMEVEGHGAEEKGILDAAEEKTEESRNDKLESLLLDDPSFDAASSLLWSRRLATMTSLRHLAIDSTYYLPHYLTSLSSLPTPPPLTSIFFLSFTQSDLDIISILTHSPPFETLRQLKSITVYPWTVALNGREPVMRGKLREVCRQRGVELRERGGGTWEGFWSD